MIQIRAPTVTLFQSQRLIMRALCLNGKLTGVLAVVKSVVNTLQEPSNQTGHASLRIAHSNSLDVTKVRRDCNGTERLHREGKGAQCATAIMHSMFNES